MLWGTGLRWPRSEIWEIDGVRLTSPARTWLDLAACLPLKDLVAAGDFFVCSHGPDFLLRVSRSAALLSWIKEVARHHGGRGLRNARIALELIRVGCGLAAGDVHASGPGRKRAAGT